LPQRRPRLAALALSHSSSGGNGREFGGFVLGQFTFKL
jgi:hypothetical protein